jgi:AcrR family transcriptional regulator
MEEQGAIGLAERQERRDAAEHRRRILAEAQRLFEEQGVEAVSMHAIAQAAGVGQGTLYRRYGNKGDLCFDLLRESAVRAMAEVEGYLTGHADAPPLTRLEGTLERLVAFTEQKLPLMAAMREAYCGEHRPMQFMNPYYVWVHGLVSRLLSEAVTRGDIRPLDPILVADFLLSAISPALYAFQREERGFSREQILAGLRRLYRAE